MLIEEAIVGVRSRGSHIPQDITHEGSDAIWKEGEAQPSIC
jgi:hypothetical protein